MPAMGARKQRQLGAELLGQLMLANGVEADRVEVAPHPQGGVVAQGGLERSGVGGVVAEQDVRPGLGQGGGEGGGCRRR